MALVQLAGPITMTYQGQTAKFLNDPQWVPGLGLVNMVFYYDSEDLLKDAQFCVVSFDGKAQVRNDNPTFFENGDLTPDLEQDEIIKMKIGSGELLRVSSITGSRKEELTDPDSVVTNGTNMARLPDRNLFVLSNDVRSIDHDQNDVNHSSLEIEETSPIDLDHPVIFSKGPKGTVYISEGDGGLVQYDYQSKKFIGEPSGIGLTNQGCWYVPEHNVFVSIHDDSNNKGHELRIWANEIEPSSLSDPVALTTLTKGRVSEVEVQLTGDLGESVSGYFVDWSLTGGGSLSSSQSVTDKEGKAKTKYIAPIDSTPSITIQASVTL